MAQYLEKNFKMKDGSEFTLRSATKDDAQIVLDYVKVIFSEAPYILMSTEDFHATKEEEGEFLDNLDKSESGIMILAIIDGKVIGNIDLRVGPYKRTKHCAGFGMSVLPQYRKLGVGRIMLSEIINYVKNKESIKKLELSVISENHSAIEFYKSVGFKEEGRSLKSFLSDQGRYLDQINMGIWLEKN